MYRKRRANFFSFPESIVEHQTLDKADVCCTFFPTMKVATTLIVFLCTIVAVSFGLTNGFHPPIIPIRTGNKFFPSLEVGFYTMSA